MITHHSMYAIDHSTLYVPPYTPPYMRPLYRPPYTPPLYTNIVICPGRELPYTMAYRNNRPLILRIPHEGATKPVYSAPYNAVLLGKYGAKVRFTPGMD